MYHSTLSKGEYIMEWSLSAWDDDGNEIFELTTEQRQYIAELIENGADFENAP